MKRSPYHLHTFTIPSAHVRVAVLRERNVSTVAMPRAPHILRASHRRSDPSVRAARQRLGVMAWHLLTWPANLAIAARCGVTDSARGIEHVSPDGQPVSLDFGTCAPPGG